MTLRTKAYTDEIERSIAAALERRFGTWTKLELIEMDRRFCAAMHRVLAGERARWPRPRKGRHTPLEPRDAHKDLRQAIAKLRREMQRRRSDLQALQSKRRE